MPSSDVRAETIGELKVTMADADKRQRKWDSAMVGYALMVGLSRQARNIMLGTFFGGLRDDGYGEYFQSERFTIGHSEVYELGGQKISNIFTTALTLIDSGETFQLALIGENALLPRATAGSSPWNRGEPINVVLEHPDSMNDHARAILAEYPRILEDLPGTAPPPWWADTLTGQTRAGMNILRLTIAALADTEYNPEPLCGHIASKLAGELCIYGAVSFTGHGGHHFAGLDV